jgi:hypothetical protein
MKEYCRAYGFIGGVAEYGSYVWDAVTGQDRVLIPSAALEQIEQLKDRLARIPGVYVHEGCEFMVRAYTYSSGRTVPLPQAMIRDTLASLRLDHLRLHQTYTDSTITAAATDKGLGLTALLEMVGKPQLTAIAVGDSEPDLPMFRAATRCFAPSQIGCPQSARLLGCHISSHPYQQGLLRIARRIVHPDGGTCPACRAAVTALHQHKSYLLELLRIADRSPVELFLRALIDPMFLRAFRM